MKRLLIFLFFIPIINFSQLSVYGEFLPGFSWSLNLEYSLVSEKKFKILARAGGGGTLNLAPDSWGWWWVSVPVGVNLLLSNGKHHIETGCGVLYDGFNTVFFLQVPVTYRYQNFNKWGVFFKAGIIADFTQSTIDFDWEYTAFDSKPTLIPQLSIGYSFNGRRRISSDDNMENELDFGL